MLFLQHNILILQKTKQNKKTQAFIRWLRGQTWFWDQSIIDTNPNNAIRLCWFFWDIVRMSDENVIFCCIYVFPVNPKESSNVELIQQRKILINCWDDDNDDEDIQCRIEHDIHVQMKC